MSELNSPCQTLNRYGLEACKHCQWINSEKCLGANTRQFIKSYLKAVERTNNG